jgi:hypothetical protein
MIYFVLIGLFLIGCYFYAKKEVNSFENELHKLEKCSCHHSQHFFIDDDSSKLEAKILAISKEINENLNKKGALK